MSEMMFYNQKANYGDLSVSEHKCIEETGRGEHRPKRTYAYLSLVHEALTDAVENIGSDDERIVYMY